MSEIATLQPSCIWKFFDEICQIPRPSKHEEKITAYLVDFARKHSLAYKQDTVGNVFIEKPATAGYENLEPVVLQAHVDMVPQKRNDSSHNFLTDPIEAYIDGNFVRARGTTLGADNGIGVSMILAVLDSKDIPHGPIQALFTIDEETGMTGAFALKEKDISAKYLINLDSENENEITIGGAGGLDANFTFDIEYSELTGHEKVYTISLTGLTGGHSGFEIILNRANANKVLCEFLYEIMEKTDLRLISFNGGNMRNAIPREATAVVAFNRSFENIFHKMFERFVAEKESQFMQSDPHLSCITAETISETKAISQEQTAGILRAIINCPNGPVKYENHNCKILNTSTNLSFVNTKDNKITIGCLIRSTNEQNKQEVANAQKAIFELYGAKSQFEGNYPGWQPQWDSQLLSIVKKSFGTIFETETNINVIHAGLECGIFADTFPTMEAVSFGPNIKGPHSPNEVVEIDSVGKTWEVLKCVLKNIPLK
ncbi:MAG: aminoacyl-histidine dipeptidase [Bacteroidales bacterium]|nr:aminoacyl-histidine dipeptidase [Bacteroidales bacterium]